ncbi:MAG: hypothetical protein ACC661_09120, partial [Verrucomicrobiales bacterium]
FNIWKPDSKERLLTYVVGNDKRGFKVDWEWYLQMREKNLSRFFENPGDKTEIFRVVVRRSHFYGALEEGETEPYTMRLETPFTKNFAGAIYQDPLSLSSQEMKRHLKWSEERMATVELGWISDGQFGVPRRVVIKNFLGWGLALDRAF